MLQTKPPMILTRQRIPAETQKKRLVHTVQFIPHHRGIAALALMRHCGLAQRAAAAELGLGTGSAVSDRVRHVKARCRADPDTAEHVRRVASAEGHRRSRNSRRQVLANPCLLFSGLTPAT